MEYYYSIYSRFFKLTNNKLLRIGKRYEPVAEDVKC